MAAQIDREKDEYSDKLAKLLPAEGTAALLAIDNLVPNDSDADLWILVALVVIGVFVIVWALRVRNINDRVQLAFLTVGYLVWAANILSGRFYEYYQIIFGEKWFTFVPALIAILYSLFIPLVFPQRD